MMAHIVSRGVEEVPYWLSITFQGHTHCKMRSDLGKIATLVAAIKSLKFALFIKTLYKSYWHKCFRNWNDSFIMYVV